MRIFNRWKKINAYTSVNIEITNELTAQDYQNIYHRLIQFIDYEKIININDFLDLEIIKYLDENLEHKNDDLRRDKWGRIGEYIFNMINKIILLIYIYFYNIKSN